MPSSGQGADGGQVGGIAQSQETSFEQSQSSRIGEGSAQVCGRIAAKRLSVW